jgi:hypothetical protein
LEVRAAVDLPRVSSKNDELSQGGRMTRSQTGLIGLPLLLAACATPDTTPPPAATAAAQRLRCEVPTGSHYPRCERTDNVEVISRETIERRGILLGDPTPTPGTLKGGAPGS